MDHVFPDDNFIDFSQPIKLMLNVDSGWVEKDGKVNIGASEKILTEDGTVILMKQTCLRT
jgi:hypothetical protein